MRLNDIPRVVRMEGESDASFVARGKEWRAATIKEGMRAFPEVLVRLVLGFGLLYVSVMILFQPTEFQQAIEDNPTFAAAEHRFISAIRSVLGDAPVAQSNDNGSGSGSGYGDGSGSGDGQ